MPKIIKSFFQTTKGKIISLALVLLLAFLGWRVFGKKSSTPQYQTAKVEKGTIVWSVSASGSIVDANLFEVTTQATGMVKKVYVTDGQKVSAGQKIMEIEPDLAGKQANSQSWNAYLSAKNNLESAKATLWTLDSAMWAANRKFINDAVSRGLTVDDPTYIQENDDWLAAEAKYKNQKATVDQAQVAVNNAWLSYQLSSPQVTAPVSGTISGVSFAPGMIISGPSSSTGSSGGTQRVAVIRTEGNPIASFNISELDVPVVKPGQKAIIKLDSLPDKTFTGKIVTVDRLGTVSSGVTNYPAIVQFDTASDEILPNMAASVSIIIETKDNVLTVPSSAVQKQAGQDIVTVLVNGKTQTRVVETGISSDTQTEIVSGLSEGEEVVTGQLSGAKIQTGGSLFGMTGGMGGAGRIAR